MSSLRQPQLLLDLEPDALVRKGDGGVSPIKPQVLRTPSFLSEVRVAKGAQRTILADRRFLVVEDETLIGIDIVAGLEIAFDRGS